MNLRALFSHLSSHVGGAIFGSVIQLTAFIVTAGLYGPSAFSALALFQAVAQILAIFTSLNLSGYSVSLNSSYKRLNFASTLVTGTVLFGILASCLAAGLAAAGSVSGMPAAQVIVLPIYIVVQAFSGIFYGLHLATARTLWAAGSLLLRPILFLVLALMFWRIKTDEFGLIAAVVLSEAMVSCTLFFGLSDVEKRQVFRVSLARWLSNWRRHHKFYLFGGFGSYMSNVAANTPIIIGGLVMTPGQLGNFALTHRLMQAPIRMIGSPIGIIVNRAIARRYSDGLQIRKHINIAYFVALLLGLLGFGSLVFLLRMNIVQLPQEWTYVVEYAPIVFSAGVFLFATSTIGFLPLLIGNVSFLVLWSGGRILAHILGALVIVSHGMSANSFLFFFVTIESAASLVFFAMNSINLSRKERS